MCLNRVLGSSSLLGKFFYGAIPKLAGSPTGAFFAAVKTVAEHFRHRLVASQKMDLEAVRLFLCARFGVDASNVFFRIRIWTFSHENCENK